jgi:long-chain fatty acid transport protein
MRMYIVARPHTVRTLHPLGPTKTRPPAWFGCAAAISPVADESRPERLAEGQLMEDGMKLHRASRYLVALSALALPSIASAQGFGLNEIGSCAIGRGFAVTSAPCSDASMVFWNPAAITSMRGSSGLIGVSAIKINADFTQDTTFARHKADVPVEFPPHLFWAMHRENSKWGFGFGAYVPYGLTSEWKDDFPGRFAARRASLQTIYAQPTIAYQINENWSIGGGPIIGHSSVELVQAVDLSEQELPTGTGTFANLGIAKRTEFARAKLEGSAIGYGFTAAIQGKIWPNWLAGLRYLHKIDFDYDDADATFQQVNTGLIVGANVPNPTTGAVLIPAGTPIDLLLAPQFQAGGALVSQKVSTKISHPAQVQAGVTYTGFANSLVSIEYAWIGWKAFKELPVNFSNDATEDRVLIEDYNNSSVLRVGGEKRYANGFAARLGFSAATSAAPPETVTPLLPEQDRYTFNVGGGLPLSQKWAIDAAYAYVGVWGERGRIDERTSRSQTAQQLNTGFYRLQAHILSVSLKASY